MTGSPSGSVATTCNEVVVPSALVQGTIGANVGARSACTTVISTAIVAVETPSEALNNAVYALASP